MRQGNWPRIEWIEYFYQCASVTINDLGFRSVRLERDVFIADGR
jgi:hypothetical protein